MKRGVIIITQNDKVSVPGSVQMRDFEIAELFEVLVPTVKGKIKQILKEGICQCDISAGGFVSGNMIVPEYYGLNIITAIAFRIQSPKAELFRRWVIQRAIVTQNPSSLLYIKLPHDTMLN